MRPSYLLKFSFAGLIAVLNAGCVTSVTPPRSLFENERPFYAKFFSSSADPAENSAATSGFKASLGPLDAYAGYRNAVTQASASAAKSSDRRALLREGMAMIEFRCGLYFDVLGKAIQEISFSRRETSLVGGLLQGGLGLANQSAKTIANTGAIFGFTTSSMDAYQDVYLYTPEIDTIRRLVLASLRANAQGVNLTADGFDLDYGQVMSLLKQYESICQPASIRSLVNRAVNAASDEGSSDKQPVVADAGTRVEIVRAAMAVALNRAAVTDDEAFYLYWAQSSKFSAATDNKFLAGKLKGFAELTSSGVVDVTRAKTLTPYFKLLGAEQIALLEKRIVTEQELLKKALAQPSPTKADPKAVPPSTPPAPTSPTTLPSPVVNPGSTVNTPTTATATSSTSIPVLTNQSTIVDSTSQDPTDSNKRIGTVVPQTTVKDSK